MKFNLESRTGLAMIKRDYPEAGFTVTHLESGIIKFVISDVTRQTIDAFIATTDAQDQEALAGGYHIRRIVILERMLLPTPYGFARLREVDAAASPELRESLAVVVPNMLTYRLLALFMDRLSSQARSVTRIFKDEESALRWLVERGKQLDSESQSTV